VNLPDRLGALGDRLDTPAGWEKVKRYAWAMLVLSFLALIVRGGSSPADPYLSGTARVPMTGFGEIAMQVRAANGTIGDWCALLADTGPQRERGLMGVTSLNGYDAMAFRYKEPSTGAFWMKNTIIPLAVAFFDANGRFVSAKGMDPCPPEMKDCPTYPAAAPFLTAVEVPRGGLGRLGIGPGSTISFGGSPCPT
jgi:uncharacterized membrane protein (UPF0127 family)